MTSASITMPSERTFAMWWNEASGPEAGSSWPPAPGGDFPMLTLDERKAVSETIVRAADGRTPCSSERRTRPRCVGRARALRRGHWRLGNPARARLLLRLVSRRLLPGVRSGARSHEHAGNHDLQHVLGGLRHVARRDRTARRVASLCRPQVVHRARRRRLPAGGRAVPGAPLPSSTTTVSRS